MDQVHIKLNGEHKIKAINGGARTLIEKNKFDTELCENHNIITYRGIRVCQNCEIVLGPAFNTNSQNKNCL
ncbi:MAG: hypothetical protein HWN67_19415 [Candidatus Helarchaeota archaeon]|nr:hypothetical protein [Candidatus Helarchaeota archaeon]